MNEPKKKSIPVPDGGPPWTNDVPAQKPGGIDAWYCTEGRVHSLYAHVPATWWRGGFVEPEVEPAPPWDGAGACEACMDAIRNELEPRETKPMKAVIARLVEGTHDEPESLAHMLSCAWVDSFVSPGRPLSTHVAVALTQHPVTREPGEFILLLQLVVGGPEELDKAVRIFLPLGAKWVIVTGSGMVPVAIGPNGEELTALPKDTEMVFGLMEKPNEYTLVAAKRKVAIVPEWKKFRGQHIHLGIGPFFEHPQQAQA